ncbi:HAMP domain-containing sensor histidine kinase [Sulfurimonas sp.]|uniref:sensor histidine kinase n=1 Tax=Sulfurimonas sp. TaxID=2022749 RepID=UPI0026114BE6|nr:HAMP domain-containing sensor histidine kinase [Sulfurimonas sp.]MCW8895616.1 HAMP domain-containing histidine kinase [Sulfurimonas sp.]MCW9067166.1 HAMP domain-containing histidine kinase [Sulfurimonas sp.]
MNKNPFSQPTIEIKRRKNPKGEYYHLNTKELLDAVRQSAHSTHRADLDILLDVFLERYDARQKELDSLNRELEERIEIEVNIGKKNYKRYEQQAKMAAMGEMMDAVAHQWKQPLNALSMMSDMLVDDFRTGDVDQAYVDELSLNTQTQIEHMVTTLNEFRNFFRPKETKENFGIKRCVQSVMLLVNDEFMKNNININIKSDKEIIIYGIENEFKHLVLNIINNAKDAFNERDIKERYINISFYKEQSYINLDIEDTAGGIPNNVIKDIFKPEVTTKEIGKGTGIGLYMSTQIAQKFDGSLSVENLNRGACFKLRIPTQ